MVHLLKKGRTRFRAGKFKSPVGVAVDSSGNVYVADTENNRIQKFKNDGTFIREGADKVPSRKVPISIGITVDSSGNVYVSEEGNHRIQKFGSTGNFSRTWGVRWFSETESWTASGI